MSTLTGKKPLKGKWKWIPWKDTAEMEQRLSTFLGLPAHIDGDQEAMTLAEWTPLIDISEDEREYLQSRGARD